MDGRPFRYVAGALHYFRIPRAYWADRLAKARAMGLDAIDVYVPWNLHEPAPGKFDFQGEKDIVSFIRLAEMHDLLVILRPGPYICAEWDWGGLPAWLLNLPEKSSSSPVLPIRSSDPLFLKSVRSWFDVLLRKLKGLTYAEGGPIIMSQLENGYGSFNVCDKQYMRELLRLHRKHLGSELVLFTFDDPNDYTLLCGSLPGEALATINFGPNKDPEKAMQLIRKYNPGGAPLVNSLFFPGWFDRWGKSHSTRPVNTVAAAFEKVLQNGFSVSIYMVHGGTNFGLSTGATSPPFMPQVTSYDYDAPISEAGDLTAKYFALQQVILKYKRQDEIEFGASGGRSPQDASLVFPSTPKAAYGEVRMDLFATLEQYLQREGKLVEHEEPLTMEALRLYSGFILYANKCTACKGLLTVNGVRDRAYVFDEQWKYLGMHRYAFFCDSCI